MKIIGSEKIEKYLDLAGDKEKLWNMRLTMIPIVIVALETNPQKLGKGTESVGNQRKNQGYLN